MATNALGVTIAVGAAASASVAHTFATVGERVKTLKGNIKSLESQSQAASALMKADAQLRDARLKHIADAGSASKGALDQAQKAFDSAERKAKRYNITVADAAKTHAGLTAQIKKTGAALQYNEALQANQARRKELQGNIMGTVATVAAVTAPIKMAADFEEVMIGVGNVTSFDEKGLARFREKLLDIPSIYGGTLEQVGTIATRGGMAKIADDELAAFTITGQKMVTAWNMTAEEAGDALAGMRKNYRMTQQESLAFLDSVQNLAGNMRKGSGGAIIEFTSLLSETAKEYGISRASTAALGSTWAALDVPAKKAKGATEAMLHALGQASKAAPGAFRGMGKTGAQIQAAFRKDAQGTMMEVLQNLQRWSGPERLKKIADIFGQGQVEAVDKLVNNLDQYQRALTLAGDETSAAGAFQKEYESLMKSTKNQLGLLREATVKLGVSIGSVMLGPLTMVAKILSVALRPVTALTSRLPVLTGTVMTVAVAFAAVKVAALGGMYAWTLVHDGYLIAGKGAKWLWGGLSKLPLLFKATTYQMLRLRGVALYTAASMKIQAAATWMVTTVQKALNLAMSSNPIGIIIRVVAAATVALLTLYATCEPVRVAVDAVISGIKDGFWSFVKVIASVYDKVSGFFGRKSTARADLEDYLGKTEEVAKAAAKIPQAQPTLAVAAAPPSMQTAVATRTAATMPVAAANRKQTEDRKRIEAGAKNFSPLPANDNALSSGIRPQSSGSGGGASISPQISFSLNFNGVPSKDVGDILVQAIKAKERDLSSYFEKMIAGIAANQRRLAYDR
jgi:TP901 family phage tail tape measure protein